MNAIKKALGLSTEPASDRFEKADIAEAKKCEQKTRDDCQRQLEFYFSDVNLPYDDFYLKARNKEGEIDCEVLANSARIKQFTKKLTPVQRAYLLWDVSAQSDSVVRGAEGFLKRRWPMPKEDKSNKNMAFLELKVDEGGPDLDKVLDESSFKNALEKRLRQFSMSEMIVDLILARESGIWDAVTCMNLGESFCYPRGARKVIDG